MSAWILLFSFPLPRSDWGRLRDTMPSWYSWTDSPKMVKLAPTYTTCTAEETAKLLLAHVFADHGLPDSNITDRGSVFTGTFWTTLLQSLGTQHCKTTAFHPQSDGQAERVNRVLEDMLRHYVGSTHQTDWDVYLPRAQFAINNSRHSATSTTPFRLNYGRDPKLPMSVKPMTREVPSVERFSKDMQASMADAKRCLESAQQRMKLYYDKHHRHVEYSVAQHNAHQPATCSGR